MIKFNKNLILLSIRDMTSLSTKEIRVAMRKYKKMYQYKHNSMIKKKLDRFQKNKNHKIIYFKMILILKSYFLKIMINNTHYFILESSSEIKASVPLI